MDYVQVGEAFVKHYYSTFDQNRQNIAPLYTDNSLLTWEKDKIQGRVEILKKLTELPFNTVRHDINVCDCQPSMSGGVNILCTGSVVIDNEHPHPFCEFFHLTNENGGFYVTNHIFRFNYGA
ncbi:hypothetical protein C9374_001450 [Naegleria lovaniensis]|uniref:Nuclear transport factor 2 n=1 Tax=Naegleria lovaniensis TaxID=51637 RepID=A0AA88GT25_NAELO|nr:uncharacterized protein C9374_001450 [Naegleria lovaniensis]KAG2387856.1 hypothetical protein C9374_001450 [Naegleria lovaniensis]